MLVEIIILILLIILAALYAGSEIVFVVVSKLKVELKAQKGEFTAKVALNYLNNPKDFLIISLVGTNIFHIAFSSTFAIIINKLFSLEPVYVMLITAFLLLVFSEIIPKVFFRENADKFIYPFTIFLIISKIIFFPIIAVINYIVNKLIQIVKVVDTSDRLSYTREDFYNLVRSSEKLQEETDETSYFIKSLELMDRVVKEIMIPRTEIIGVNKNAETKDIIDIMNKYQEDKVIIYENNIDNILGYIEIKDLLEEHVSIDKIIKPVIYIPESLKCSDLLIKFQYERKYISVVVDEFGGTAGLITYRKLLEEIIGDIAEGKDYWSSFNKKLDNNTYIFSGRIELDLLNEKYNLDIYSDEAVTLGGFITEKTGKIPKVGEIVKVNKFKFKILKASKTRIELVELKIEK